MEKVRWGLLSTSRFAQKSILPALAVSERNEMVALASRSPEIGAEVAAKWQIPTVHSSYEALLADPNIEAVYIPLPNHLHLPYAQKALAAGKHVLCEKPIGLNAQEAQALQQTAMQYPHLKVMEAFMYRFHPQWQQAKQWVVEGKIGALKQVTIFFSYMNTDSQNVRNVPHYGGGGLLDIGCYAISAARWLFDSPPKRVMAWLDLDPLFKTDRFAGGILDFGTGLATFSCATQLQAFQQVQVLGTEGRIEIETPFNPLANAPAYVNLQQGAEVQRIEIPPCNHYVLQFDAFAQSIRHHLPPPTPLSDALANMQVLDACIQSHQTATWASIEDLTGS